MESGLTTHQLSEKLHQKGGHANLFEVHHLFIDSHERLLSRGNLLAAYFEFVLIHFA